MRLELVVTGAELIDGRRADSHTQRLAARLRTLDLTVARATIVGDGQTEIAAALRDALARAELVICTGGLGPTTDDRTREAAAEVFGRPLIEDEAELRHLRELFAQFGREMTDNNRQQAMFPQGAEVLPNPMGTAPGFLIADGEQLAFFTPGPPRELEVMIEREILPRLARLPHTAAVRAVTYRTFGEGESWLDKRLREVDWEGVDVAYTATMPEILLTLTATAAAPAEAESRLLAARAKLEALIGPSIISDDGRTLEEVVGALLTESGRTLAIAESCTGGMIAARCTDVPGSSAWFLEGAVVYDNAAKTRRLGLPEALLAEHGAVSEPVAVAMAEGMRRTAGVDFALAVTGIAGPTGGTPDKPVGTVYLALAAAEGTQVWLNKFPGDRRRVRQLTAENALNRLRRRLLS